MKTSEFRKLIREEIKKVLTEGPYDLKGIDSNESKIEETNSEVPAGFLKRIDKNKPLKVGDITTLMSGKLKGKRVKIVKDFGKGSYEVELIREEVRNALRPSSHNLVNESTSEYFTKSLPHAKYKYQYNDTVANGKYKIEVFGYNHKTVADDLHKALLSSGFLEKYPLFSVRVDPMSGYEPI